MLGQMMQQPLLISMLLVHAERHHPEQEIVSRRVEGDLHRLTYTGLAERARRMAKAVIALGVQPGERVGTLAWNGHRHVELYYAVSGVGAVIHTVNPRLHPDQVVYIADHAEDRVLFFDLTFLPIIEAIAARTKTIKAFVAMTDRAHLPVSAKVPGLLCYEDLLEAQDDRYDWPSFDENAASSLCYTSGTTGNPKGVLYSHRSTLLHTFGVALPDSLNCSARDTILPVVPMFHVNAWGLPYAACMVGAKLVFPGPGLDGKSLHDLFESERVTLSAGVPTVWQGLLAHVSAHGLKFSTMRRTVIGGSACPPAMIRTFKENYDVDVLHAWGMTEMSPVGTTASFKRRHVEGTQEERFAVMARQGRAVFGVDMKIVDPEGRELPRDGQASGDLLVRGPWIISRYFKDEGGDPLVRDPAGHGWFPTGDVAKIDADGLHADHRPQQGCDQVRRRVDRVDRPREHRDGAPGGGDGGMHRRAAPEVGRAAAAGGREEARRRGHARADPGLLRGPHRQVVDAGRRGLRRRDSARRHRQDAEEQAARAVARPPAADGLKLGPVSGASAPWPPR
jgi:3-(methylthio)propionyl---CoA ligase